MAFQLKNFVSITAAMINRAKASQTKITDFNIGSVARTLMEAPAIEIEELYQRMFAGIIDAIPVAIYRGFNFELLGSAKAYGGITITFGAPLEVAFSLPAGTVFQAPATGNRYLLVSAVEAGQGDTSLSGIIEAENAGSAYNVAANAISVVLGVTLPTGSTITHPALTSGSDGETEIERASRFAEFIESISRGTLAAVRYAAASAKILNGSGEVIEYVTRIGHTENPGDVKIYIYGAGQVASAGLVAEAQKIVDGYWDGAKYIPGYRSVGVNVLILPMEEIAYDVGVTVEMAYGYTFDASVASDIEDRVSAVISSIDAEKTLYIEDLNDAVLRATGVHKVRLDITENYVCPANSALVPGTITVEEA